MLAITRPGRRGWAMPIRQGGGFLVYGKRIATGSVVDARDDAVVAVVGVLPLYAPHFLNGTPRRFFNLNPVISLLLHLVLGRHHLRI
jgi:hypothetical protein